MCLHQLAQTAGTGSEAANAHGEPTTRDGCPVELYRRLPYGGEVDLFAPYIPSAISVLELGCGTGRITRALLEKGFRVVAVDNSPDMLSLVPRGTQPVLSDIEALHLGQEFDVVLLASHLINTPEEAIRGKFLESCRRHLHHSGALVLQRHDPDWLLRAAPGPAGSAGGIGIFLEEASREGDIARLCLRYEDGTSAWRHRFAAQALDDAAISQALRAHGFGAPKWLDTGATWALAKPATPQACSR